MLSQIMERSIIFAGKHEDIVGLHLSLGEHVLMLCCDEKSSIQPGLPMKKGRAAAMTHDCKRHGATTLFAILKGGSKQSKEYTFVYNQSPMPSVWATKANDNLQKIIRANHHSSAKQNDSLY